MERVREQLVASTNDPKSFAKYKLVEVQKDQVSSGGQTFARGQMALADPDTYALGGEDHRAVWCMPHKGHIMLPAKEVKEAT